MRLSQLSKKTWKRELSLVLVLWLIYLSIWGSLGALEIVVFPAFLFIYGAFGLDQYAKNIMPNRDAGSGILRSTEPSEPTDGGRT